MQYTIPVSEFVQLDRLYETLGEIRLLLISLKVADSLAILSLSTDLKLLHRDVS